ncbi:MAG: sigma-70 family RNA polymerase sigma factor [Clostridia bacterium]|nr:sigma-70 family RNA polymerase sigma factor [Clostridia bacterium]
MKYDLRLIVVHLKQGEKQYFEQFYESTKTGVFFTILKIVKSRATAEDIMQDTYRAFLDSLDRIDADKNVYAYLLSIAKNRALNHILRNPTTVDIDNAQLSTSDTIDLDAPLIQRCRAMLSEEEWVILELCIIMGYTQLEVSRMLNKPASTINWQLRKTLIRVKQFYGEVYGEQN